jgi:geranylgeranyl diphosphate synthase type II
MDDDDYRRGKLTNHKVYGEAEALLAGDSLLTYAFELLASNVNVSEKSSLLAIKCLSKCSGVFGMAGGQMIDLNANETIKSYDQLTKMHAMKTGALIKCAALLGYYAYTDNPNKKIEEQLESFAINLGIAFQIRDDVLDEISSTESLGKAVGSDKKNGKITALSYMKLNEAQEQINKLTKLSIEAIQSILGEKAHVLVELAKYLIERDK